jgi:hydroxymethylglutaryl-CoA synthase
LANNKVGVLGYGVYIPWQRIQTEAIVRARERGRKDLGEFLDKVRNGLLLRYKSIASHSEDTITMATEAAENAIKMAGINPEEIGTVAAGSESKPYAVGQIARHVASFIGVKENAFTADLEGACNAGMQALSFVESDIRAGKIEYGLAIGSDVAQAPRGDPLEYAAGAGAGAFVLGKEGDFVATIEDIVPYSSLTMDFWRREEVPVPSHLGRTTVEAYIQHVLGAIATLLRKYKDLRISDFDHITFHQPSGYMPLKACKTLLQPPINPSSDLAERMKLTEEDIERKVKPWLRVLDTGNTYAASTPIATASILDRSKPGDNILAVSYGSGAYANATWLRVQEGIKRKVKLVPTVEDYVNRRTEIRLQTYQDHLLERLRRIRKYFESYRLVGDIEPFGPEKLEVLLCDGCKRVYYPVRDKCLSYDCKGNLERRTLPRHARLRSFKQLSLRERWITNFDVIKGGQALLVDCAMSDLKLGMPLEAVTRRLDYEGKEGLIIYGPAYRPMFRGRTAKAS